MSGLSWRDVPSHLLRAELLRRQEDERPTCGTKGGKGHYNTPAHVFALVLILTLSTAGQCAFLIIMPDSMLIASSMRLPNRCQALPSVPRSTSLSLPLSSLWDWCAYFNGTNAPVRAACKTYTDIVCELFRPSSTYSPQRSSPSPIHVSHTSGTRATQPCRAWWL